MTREELSAIRSKAGRSGGIRGGPRRAEVLSRVARSAIARQAAMSRWSPAPPCADPFRAIIEDKLASAKRSRSRYIRLRDEAERRIYALDLLVEVIESILAPHPTEEAY